MRYDHRLLSTDRIIFISSYLSLCFFSSFLFYHLSFSYNRSQGFLDNEFFDVFLLLLTFIIVFISIENNVLLFDSRFLSSSFFPLHNPSWWTQEHEINSMQIMIFIYHRRIPSGMAVKQIEFSSRLNAFHFTSAGQIQSSGQTM